MQCMGGEGQVARLLVAPTRVNGFVAGVVGERGRRGHILTRDDVLGGLALADDLLPGDHCGGRACVARRAWLVQVRCRSDGGCRRGSCAGPRLDIQRLHPSGVVDHAAWHERSDRGISGRSRTHRRWRARSHQPTSRCACAHVPSRYHSPAALRRHLGVSVATFMLLLDISGCP